MADHLVNQGGTWHVRLTVPKDIQPLLGKSILSRSMKTSSRIEAKNKSLRYLAIWKAQFEFYRSKKESFKDHPKEIAIERAIENEERYKENFKRIVNKDSHAHISESEYLNLVEYLVSQCEAGQISYETMFKAGQLLRDGVNLEAKARKEKRELTDSERLNIHEMQKQYNIILNLDKISSTFKQNEAEREEIQRIFREPEKYIKEPFSKKLILDYKNYISKRLKPKTADQQLSRLEKISSYFEKTKKEFNFRNVSNFIESVSDSISTKKQYLWAGNAFWAWAVKFDDKFEEKYSKIKNPFENHALPKRNKLNTNSYFEFSKNDLERIYIAAKNTDQNLADVIEIAAYTGCRIEEIGRLRNQDIVNIKSESPYIIIHESKTKSGEREIPINPKLIKTLIRLMSGRAKSEYLFSGGKNLYGNRFDYLSKRFGRLKTSLGFDKKYTFHSIRKTTATQLHQGGAFIGIIPYILGHKIGSITYDTYSAGPSLEQKKVAIAILDFEFI
ncbi:MAG: hypothetical protein CVV07_06920 [Gammaproteobacteria bacterium HGW-Gammaproteobacteria-11]|nr:MAG: hypothetical protein CVV07_06920 [Gammaproteobacteria bacterium HGW-Gammaproteobacteria-11]